MKVPAPSLRLSAVRFYYDIFSLYPAGRTLRDRRESQAAYDSARKAGILSLVV